MKPGVLLAVLLSGAAVAASPGAVPAPPHLGERGVDGYRMFLAAGLHRAFAIAPGGAWAWRADLPSPEMAEQAVLDDCRGQTAQTCVTYAIDERVVFDAKAWPKLWGPYAAADDAQRSLVGVRRGERFPDLVLRDAAGRTSKVSDWRGKVVVLHFWGSWCGPCRHELPDLERLATQLAGERDIRFVFLPVREPFKTAGDWATARKLHLALFDSGVDGQGDKSFTLADGARLPDRQVAGKFPSTYVLDKHGLVVFAQIGAASRWAEYAPFLRDVAAHSGK